MKTGSFVPTFWEVLPEEAGEVPGLRNVVSFWAGGDRRTEDWIEAVGAEWGSPVVALRRGRGVLGFAVYGPPEYLPRAGVYPLGPPDEDAGLLAYVGGDDRTRRHLLVRVLKEFRHRKAGAVEAIASDTQHSRHVSTRFLLENGWRPVRQAFYRGRPYTLARVDLKSTVEVGEMARGWIGRVKLPSLKPASPAPGALMREAAEELKTAGSRS